MTIRKTLSVVLLSLLFVVSAGAAQANTVSYYVSPLGNDSWNGSSEFPWRTLNRVQDALDSSPTPGAIMFERNGVYHGELHIDQQLQRTGDETLRIGAYGEGDPPILSALTTLNQWSIVGGNLWQSQCLECSDRNNLLLIDGEPQRKARHPNFGGANDAYLYFDGFSGTDSLNDAALLVAADWSGSELVVRSVPWVLDVYPVLSHRDDTLQLDTPFDDTSYGFEVGYGYFLQNHPDFLDRHGEWVQSETNIFLVFEGDPNQSTIEVNTSSNVLTVSSNSNVEIADLVVHGGQIGLSIYDADSITLNNLQILYADTALAIEESSEVRLSDSMIAKSLSNGISAWGCERCIFHHNVIEKIALLAGMGRGGDGAYNGADIHGNSTVFENNVIRHVGYNGLSIGGGVLARYNLIHDFALVKVDSGGIGTYQSRGDQIIGNIVLNGRGNLHAIPWDDPSVNGIYIDDGSQNTIVEGNTIAFISGTGVNLHNTNSITVNNNLIVSTQTGILINNDGLHSFESGDNTVLGNRFFAWSDDTHPIWLQSAFVDLPWLEDVGHFENNRYCSRNPNSVIGVSIAGHDFQEFSLRLWQDMYQQDLNSYVC